MLSSVSCAQPRALTGLPCRRIGPHSKLIARSKRPESAAHDHTGPVEAFSVPVAEEEEEFEEYYPTVADTSVPTVYASAPPPPSSTPIIERVGSGAFYAGAAFLGATFLVAIVNFWRKFNLRENRERRKRLKNLDVVTTLSKLLPSHREAVTSSMIGSLRFKTGFTATEIFRKFLWYVLRDRQFNPDALDDLLHLKRVMQLTDDDVAQALKERSIRIEAKYGNLMLQTAGLSEKAVLKKATCRALFSKMLYLVENEQVISPDNTIFNLNELRNIFGATEEDVGKLRIISLQEVDLDVLNNMVSQDDSGAN